MIESILNIVFSIPYLLIGIIIAVFLDVINSRKKATKRLTGLEIWGCIMGWPLLIFTIILAYIIVGND